MDGAWFSEVDMIQEKTKIYLMGKANKEYHFHVVCVFNKPQKSLVQRVKDMF